MIYNYDFKGLVYPERVDCSLQVIPKLEFSWPDFNIHGYLKEFVIENCKLGLVFETDKEINQKTDPNIETLKNFIEKICRTFIDSYCFVHSYNYDLTIDSVICKETKLDYQFPVVGEFKLKNNSLSFEQIIGTILLTGDFNAISASLSDFRRSIKYPEATAFFCLRAIETLRRAYFDDISIIDDNKRDKDGWVKMARELGVGSDLSYTKMQNFAKPNRHGIYPPITYKEREEIMTYTRKVINTFITWLNKKKL